MSDIKFSCPHCQQHILAEAGYAGLQIACPGCQGNIMIPGTPVSAVPAPSPVSTQAVARQSTLGLATVEQPTTSARTSGCPSCGGALPHGAVLCTQCGYNLATGQRIVAGRPAAPGKPGGPQWETPFYKTPYPYLGVFLLVLGVLYYIGREKPAVMLALIGTGALYSIVMHLIVVIAAFKESVGTGFLSLCIPFYALYFVFKVSDSDTLKILYAFAVLINIVLRFVSRLE